MKIHIMGASCAGATTLGRALSARLGMPCFDTDDYFWAPSAVPYTVRREPAERIAMLKADFAANNDAIVSGSLVSWGDEWLTMFDVVVFLYIPHEIRMQRLVAREVERYGDAIYTDPERIRLFDAFKSWATGYDDNSTNGRNLQVHQNWIKKLNCPVLEITGDTTVEERIDLVTRFCGSVGSGRSI